MAVPFAAVTVFLVARFAAGLVEREFRTSLPVYIVLMGISAAGLWLVRSWGRSMALIVAVGNAGVGGLALLAAIVAGSFDAGSAILFIASIAVAYTLTTAPFTLPREDR